MPFNFQRFTDCLNAHADASVREKLIQGRAAYDTLTTPVQTAKWIGSLISDLNEKIGVNAARSVMEDCGRHCIGHSVLERAKSSTSQRPISMTCWTNSTRRTSAEESCAEMGM